MDYAAEELMRKMTEKGVEVELRYERSNLRSNFRAVLGEDVVTQEDAAELGENSEASLTKIEDLSEYEPVRLFRNYMESFSQGTELNKQASDISSDLNLDVHKKTIEEGLNTIERIQNSVVTYGSNASETAIKYSGNNVNNLHLERLVLKNFGPYGGKAITYPLADRGLVLLRGQSSDGTGADSNGSGKVNKNL